jgi:hypothetical protein
MARAKPETQGERRVARKRYRKFGGTSAHHVSMAPSPFRLGLRPRHLPLKGEGKNYAGRPCGTACGGSP